MAKNREFVNRRLHSLLGVIPVGVFLMQHLVVNNFATKGAEAFNKAAAFIGESSIQLFLRNFYHLSYHYFFMLFMALYCIYS